MGRDVIIKAGDVTFTIVLPIKLLLFLSGRVDVDYLADVLRTNPRLLSESDSVEWLQELLQSAIAGGVRDDLPEHMRSVRVWKRDVGKALKVVQGEQPPPRSAGAKLVLLKGGR